MFEAREVCVDIQALVGAIVLLTMDRSVRVDESRTLLKYRVGKLAFGVEGGCRGGHQLTFDLIGREVWFRFQNEGRDATHDRSALRGAGHVVIRFAVVELRVFFYDLAAFTHESQQAAAGCNHFGLHEPFMGWAGGRKRSQDIVSEVLPRPVVRHRPDGNDVGHVAGNADAHRVGASISR